MAKDKNGSWVAPRNGGYAAKTAEPTASRAQTSGELRQPSKASTLPPGRGSAAKAKP